MIQIRREKEMGMMCCCCRSMQMCMAYSCMLNNRQCLLSEKSISAR